MVEVKKPGALPVSAGPPAGGRAAAEAARYKQLAAEFAVSLERAEAERDRLGVALRDGYRSSMERATALRRAIIGQRRAELALEETRARLRLLDPLVQRMNDLITEMEASRFWKIRNGWFDLKKKLKRHPFGASKPFVMPPLDRKSVV